MSQKFGRNGGSSLKMIINNSLKVLLAASMIALIGSSCSSDPGKGPKKDVPLKKTDGKVVQVDILDKKELKKRGVDTDSDRFNKAILNTGFVTDKVWYKMQEEFKDYAALRNKPISELKVKLDSASAEEATLLIEVLSQKGETAVSVLVERLNDKRACAFKGDDAIYWYEEKNKPPQDLELRVFAAMHLEKMTGTSPYGVTFDFHNIKTDTGSASVLYAIKGSYAVSKDDVCKSWLKWWSVYGGDYK